MVGLGADLADLEPALRAERLEVLERDDMDVGRVVPLKGQLRVYGQVAAEEKQQADAVGREVGERDDRLARLVKETREKFARVLDGLKRL